MTFHLTTAGTQNVTTTVMMQHLLTAVADR